MDVSLDPDVQRVAEFMQREIPADRVIEVAQGIAALAPLLWRSGSDPAIVRLREPPLVSRVPQ
jgi:hypothetical protein